jgi:sec-independent protein translocase protein TatA
MQCGNIGGWEIIAIVAVLLLLFGGKKIPELARGLGRGIGEFREGMKEHNPPKPPHTPPSGEAKDPPQEPPKPQA